MTKKNKDKSYKAAFSRELFMVKPPGPWPDPPEKYVSARNCVSGCAIKKNDRWAESAVAQRPIKDKKKS
jgi:hypothetical protein